jgi:hypothetical protein
MSTRGIVGIPHDAGFTGRYFHSDAYPTWTGPQLLKLYREHGSAQAVIEYLTRPGEAGYWTNIGGDWQEADDFRELITNTEDAGAEWAWLLSERGIDVVAAMRIDRKKAIGRFGDIGRVVWEHVGRVVWDAEEVDWLRIECGKNLERCIHYAWRHFPEAKDSRLGTSVWLGREQPGQTDVTELIVNSTGKRIKLSGSGNRGTAHHQYYDPDARTAYWWCSMADSPFYLRVFRCLKSGYKLDKDYTGVVVTAAGEQLIPAGTVLT